MRHASMRARINAGVRRIHDHAVAVGRLGAAGSAIRIS